MGTNLFRKFTGGVGSIRGALRTVVAVRPKEVVLHRVLE